MTTRQARHQQRLAAEGYCATSRAHGPAVPGARMCRECLDARALALGDTRATRVEAGLCRDSATHGQAAAKRRVCQACLDAQAARARERRRLRRAAQRGGVGQV